MRQELIWMPKGIDVGAPCLRCRLDYNGERPKRLWTILGQEKPILPMIPSHGVNAFLEDYIHDWDIVNGKLQYYSRISEGECWLLLEFEN